MRGDKWFHGCPFFVFIGELIDENAGHCLLDDRAEQPGFFICIFFVIWTCRGVSLVVASDRPPPPKLNDPAEMALSAKNVV